MKAAPVSRLLMMGGLGLMGDRQDIHERKLINVVEEMSIASGVPMPEVFILDRQRGINAFAAGYTMDDARSVSPRAAYAC